MNTNYEDLSRHPDLPGGRRNLEDLENVITANLSSYDQVALAMLEIHDHRLYRNGHGTFKDYLLRRWQLSRARGYQLLHFGRPIQLSTTVDIAGPENERQARLLDGRGKARCPSEEDPVQRAMNYLVAAYKRLHAPDRLDFVKSLK